MGTPMMGTHGMMSSQHYPRPVPPVPQPATGADCMDFGVSAADKFHNLHSL